LIVDVLPQVIVEQRIPILVVAAVPEQEFRTAVGVVISGVDEGQIRSQMCDRVSDDEPLRQPRIIWRTVTLIALRIQRQCNELPPGAVSIAG
jgi:hypothetical protein